MKGVTCQLIESMDTNIFLNNFKLFEMNLYLLSPYQVKKKIVLKHTTLSKLDRLELGSFYFVFGFFSIFFQNSVCLDLSVSIFYFNLLCGNLSIIMLHFDNFICPLQIAKNSYSPSDLLIHE